MTREDIARIIKESRIAAGLTQIQVAEALSRPQNTISAWEMGRAQPDVNTLFELFRVLGRSVDEAFGFTVESFNVTAHERAHIEKYRALDPYGKNAVDRLLETEYSRCIVEQNLVDYKIRLSELNDAIARIQQEAQTSDERTLDDITKEILLLKPLLEGAMCLEDEMDKAHGTFGNPAVAHTGDPQSSPAPQGKEDAIPPSDVPETPPEGK